MGGLFPLPDVASLGVGDFWPSLLTLWLFEGSSNRCTPFNAGPTRLSAPCSPQQNCPTPDVIGLNACSPSCNDKAAENASAAKNHRLLHRLDAIPQQQERRLSVGNQLRPFACTQTSETMHSNSRLGAHLRTASTATEQLNKGSHL